MLVKTTEIRLNFTQQRLIILVISQLEQICRVLQTLIKIIDSVDDDLERGAFLAELLGILLIIPDLRVTQLKLNLCQTLLTGIIVKGTPSERQCALSVL
jgi:hypothetical protein